MGSLPPLGYLLPRLIRHFLHAGMVRLLLDRNLIIHPGVETSAPLQAVDSYLGAMQSKNISWQGERVMLFGYGGSYAVGCHLLRCGVGHVVLCEKMGFPDNRRNRTLLPEFGDYLELKRDRVVIRPEFFTIFHGDIRTLTTSNTIPPVDIMLSISVFEHLDDVPGITQALSKLTAQNGINLHYIDLRDHYFKYPFEMLRFSETTWQRWLNPTSNHNRYRMKDYEHVFCQNFGAVEVEVVNREEHAFKKVIPKIRPEFLTGDPVIDSVSIIRVWTEKTGHRELP
jgi:hypothetical protein